MKILPEQKKFLEHSINTAIASDPLVSIRKIQEIVKVNTGRSISDKYVARLMVEGRRTAVTHANREKLDKRMDEIRQRYQKHIKILNIIFYKTKRSEFKYSDRLASIKLAAQLDLMLLRAELLVGVFDEQCDVVEVREQIGITGY